MSVGAAIALAVAIILLPLVLVFALLASDSPFEGFVLRFDEWQTRKAREGLRKRNMLYRYGFIGYILWLFLDMRKKRKNGQLKTYASTVLAVSICAQSAPVIEELPAEQLVEGGLVQVVATLASETDCHAPESWGWGSEEECPRNRIARLRVTWGEKKLFVPLSAFHDLAAVRTVEVIPEHEGFVIVIAGGDAATSYRATLTFVPGRHEGVLAGREVHHGEFPDTVWEKTTYHSHYSLSK